MVIAYSRGFKVQSQQSNVNLIFILLTYTDIHFNIFINNPFIHHEITHSNTI